MSSNVPEAEAAKHQEEKLAHLEARALASDSVREELKRVRAAAAEAEKRHAAVLAEAVAARTLAEARRSPVGRSTPQCIDGTPQV